MPITVIGKLQQCNKLVFENVLIGFTQLLEKLVFGEYLLSLRASAIEWRGNPPVRWEMYRKAPETVEFSVIFGGNRYPVPFNRGIATPVCALVRNDR